VAQGDSLRQIARSYATSYEAVRRVLMVSHREMEIQEPSDLMDENAQQ
jgi:hypothetical protein